MTDVLDLEKAARKPWTVAEDGSMWIASGRYPGGGTFEDCLLRCVPSWMHGTTGYLFEVLLYGEVKLVGPEHIDRAREVFLVWAEDPLTAVEGSDQDTVDHALRDRGMS